MGGVEIDGDKAGGLVQTPLAAKVTAVRSRARGLTEFSKRERVGWEARSRGESGAQSSRIMRAGSEGRRSESLQSK